MKGSIQYISGKNFLCFANLQTRLQDKYTIGFELYQDKRDRAVDWQRKIKGH